MTPGLVFVDIAHVLGVTERDVVFLEGTLDRHLPVARIAQRESLAEPQVAEVELGEKLPEGGDMFVERWSLAVNVHEDQVQVLPEPDRFEPVKGRSEGRVRVPILAADTGRGDQLSRKIVGPSVPGAAQGGSTLARFLQDAHGAMTADVVERAKCPVLPPNDNQRPACQRYRHRIPGVRQMAGERHRTPGSGKQSPLLESVELGIVGPPGQPFRVGRRTIKGRDLRLAQEV